MAPASRRRHRRSPARAVKGATDRYSAAGKRVEGWANSRDPASLTGVAVGTWRRYKAVDGPLQSALLSLYIMIAILPALIVIEAYLDKHPGALAHHLVRHYDLSPPTARLLRDVLVESRAHEATSALIAIVGSLFFGLGFGKVLQLVHARAWRIDLPSKGADQARYGLVLLGLFGLITLLLVQLKELSGSSPWIDPPLELGWIVVLVLFFLWAPWVLLHRLVPARDLLPGAILTAFGLVVLMVISSYVMEFWLNFYARDYGGFGVTMAIFFWIAFSSAVIVWAAAISPLLTDRRRIRKGP